MMDNEKAIKKLIIVVCGLIISVVGAMIWTNGGYEKDGLLHFGKIYEFSEEALQTGNESCIYDTENNRYVVQSESAELNFDVTSKVDSWKFCTVELDDVEILPVTWYMQFFDDSGNVIFNQYYTLRQGKNIFSIKISESIHRIKITMVNQNGSAFRIKNMRLQKKYLDAEDFLKKTMVIFMGCVVCYMLVWASRHYEWYAMIELLQNFYIWLGDARGSRMAAALSLQVRKRLQVLCFTIMFLLMIVMNVTCGQNYNETGRYWMFGFGALWIMIGVLSWQSPLKKLNWRNGTCLSWLLLWAMVSLSDLFVMKSFSYVGYIMVLCIGFAFFIWHNTGSFQQMLHTMMNGLKWTLPVITVYCILFRQKKVGVYYNGCFSQHESMAMYALALMIVFLAECNLLICQEKWHQRRFVFNGIGAVWSMFFLYYSRSYWCVAAAASIVGAWIILQICSWRSWRQKGKELVISGITIIVGGLLVTVGVKEAVKVIPERLGTNIIYENEVQESMVSEELMYALEAEQPGWIEGVVSAEAQDRKIIWQTYMQKINLIGNEDNLREKEQYLNPSNGVIQMAYRYGMFVLIPYAVLLMQCLYTAFHERKFLWLATVLAFTIVMFFENMEIPFAQPLWLMVYFGIGRFFGNDIEEDTRLNTYEDYN